ncbi:MAG: polyribonucleotide nucleotidyltransferase [Candidatus Wildermuthbacteria bacterium RIFCSPLOWO2_02_FULL_47_9c]|nr:MAG: polyribonucleotide nucleotidyltransferase [Candidatus Wildermuthbacteria bacterium GWA1_49_26]OHA65474.1 MAG: polyribonucleotide nucleotidyltransferase [Candidatus Wildermuthbacteria bacterium RIFCSPHIGHO2_01_FULL_50_47]OHA69649.1 MAG: polyribonucleotide nucleotidyltransferase [Candidatus Wildermuthbacteria bacterium RIFCSPHIGHO2_02_FULL_49_17]OHA72060.1 MAG: polyribonucleotide nucleotidyltransferase [Candidatus Wildermuthbacteria bacterium RIFCSPHIGHO2_12_FULL_49_13]OHA75272.1 MAG: pol
MTNFTCQLGEKSFHIELPNWAEQANGNVLVKSGETVTLVTAVMGNELPNQGFFPLTVDYEERFYAAGKILGSRFMRREGRPSDEAIITARLIDRAIRPLFPKNFLREVQVICTCLSWDAQNDPDLSGLLGASLALSLSNIPWKGPIAAVRIGRVQGNFVLNPAYQERAESDLDFVLAGQQLASPRGEQDGELVFNMIEAEGDEIPEETYEQALAFAEPFLIQLLEFQKQIIARGGVQKILHKERDSSFEDFEKEFRAWLDPKLEQALFQGEKQKRMASLDEVKKEYTALVTEKYSDLPAQAGAQIQKYAELFFEEEIDRIVHKGILERDQRVDDRKPDEIRPLAANAGFLPRTHGSGLFERGQTRTLSILTLGAPGDQRLLEGMEFIGKKRFMHHYNFPPYAPGEVKPMRGPGRREIGHGILAEKSLFPVIPAPEEFPYTIRIVTEVVSSNGSTSMAAVCSSTLALLDAGVPIKRPVAGISMGLMKGEGDAYKLLTDIQGPEDKHGDMDFKVAGTKQGICAIQLDVKVTGITKQMFKETLAAARKARWRIIDEVIAKVLPEPRAELSPWAPKIATFNINPEKIGLLIGSGGKTINRISEEYGVEIDIEETGQVFITSQDKEQLAKAVEFVQNLTHEVQVGDIFVGKVKRILEFGAFVEIPGGQEGLVHISQLAPHRVNKVQDVVKLGQTVSVKVIEIDELGRVNLSMKETREHQQG